MTRIKNGDIYQVGIYLRVGGVIRMPSVLVQSRWDVPNPWGGRSHYNYHEFTAISGNSTTAYARSRFNRINIDSAYRQSYVAQFILGASAVKVYARNRG